MDAIVIVGKTKDKDTFESIYGKAVEAYNANKGSRAVWIVFDNVAIRVFVGNNLESTKADYLNLVAGVKKSE